MHRSLKIASAALLGFALLTVKAPDAHAGRPGACGHRHGHGGHGIHGRGHIRHHGLFSHRHWDRRFHRWMYFYPGYNRWYVQRWYVQCGNVWVPVAVDEAPGIPDDDLDE
jgi:hypothetical protein